MAAENHPDRIGEVEAATREAIATMPELELLYVAGKHDDHPMRTRKDGTYRVVISGWSASLHRCAVHRVVGPTPHGSADTLRHEVENQLRNLIREQKARADAGWKIVGIREPVPRLPFDQDNDGLDVDHIMTDVMTVSRLQAEEGSDAGVRRRISLAVNAILRQREAPGRPPAGDTGMDRWTLVMPLSLGERATLQGNQLFLKDRLPETVLQALGGSVNGLRLSRIVEAPGIDDFVIAAALSGRMFANDPRHYARDSATMIALLGNAPGRVRDLLRPR
jgi:hypothetical protein